MKEVFDKFGLEAGTRDFIGHAMALYLTDEEYIQVAGKAPEAIERIRLYGNSVARYGKSPYIYPALRPRRAAPGLRPPVSHLRRHLHAQHGRRRADLRGRQGRGHQGHHDGRRADDL